MTDRKDAKPHFFLGPTGKPEPYTSTSTGGGKKQEIPEQNRQQHSSALLSQLQQIQTDQQTLKSEASAYPLESAIGIQVEFESFPGIELAVESLANETQKIELLNVIHRQDKTFATIFAPEGRLSVFEKKLHDYLSEKKNKNGGAIDNRPLIDAMCEQFSHGNTPRQKAQHRVRCVGFGVPNLDRALWSANNSLALVIEDRLQPFDKIKGKAATTRDMHLHDLPWPKESLLAFGVLQEAL